MNKLILLKITRINLLAVAGFFWLKGVILLFGGETSYLTHSPLFSAIVLLVSLEQYSTYSRKKNWLITIGVSLVWTFLWTSLFPKGITVTLTQTGLYGMIFLGLAGLTQLFIKKMA